MQRTPQLEISWVEQEETSRGVPSAQFFNLKGLKTALALDGIYGCCSLVAPSSFQRSISDWSKAEWWGQRLLSARPLYNLLCLTAPEQWHMRRDLRSDQEWYALTRSGTLGSQKKALLLTNGQHNHCLLARHSSSSGQGWMAPGKFGKTGRSQNRR